MRLLACWRTRTTTVETPVTQNAIPSGVRNEKEPLGSGKTHLRAGPTPISVAGDGINRLALGDSLPRDPKPGPPGEVPRASEPEPGLPDLNAVACTSTRLGAWGHLDVTLHPIEAIHRAEVWRGSGGRKQRGQVAKVAPAKDG